MEEAVALSWGGASVEATGSPNLLAAEETEFWVSGKLLSPLMIIPTEICQRNLQATTNTVVQA